MTARSKVAIVTGGSGGIGQAICLALGKLGFRVAVVGRRAERVARTTDLLRELPGSPPHLGLALDLTHEASAQEMVQRTVERLGGVDLLVAGAGIGRTSGSNRVFPHPTESLPLSEWDDVIRLNLTGIFLCNRAVVPVMQRQGGGHIVNVCSSTTPRGLRGRPYAPAYCASKFGVVGLSEALAAEVSSSGIRVQVVFPGPVSTRLVRDTLLSRPFGGAITPESLAATVLFLVQQPSDAVVVHPHVIPFGFPAGRPEGTHSDAG